MDQKQIVDEFCASGHTSEGELYFPLDVARRVIIRCCEARIAILGLEGFELVGGRELHPRVDLIADFSSVVDASLPWERKVRQTARDAAEFIDSVVGLAPHVLVNFVFKAPKDG
jgi:hypothetical protein